MSRENFCRSIMVHWQGELKNTHGRKRDAAQILGFLNGPERNHWLAGSGVIGSLPGDGGVGKSEIGGLRSGAEKGGTRCNCKVVG